MIKVSDALHSNTFIKKLNIAPIIKKCNIVIDIIDCWRRRT